MHKKYTEEIRQFIREHAPGMYNKDLAALASKHFGIPVLESAVVRLKYKMGVKSGIDATFMKGVRRSPATEFKKGHVPINKGTKGMFPGQGGATRYKKGHVPHNYRPVGSERCNVDGYWEVKVADPKTWKLKHVLLWEEVNGPVPKGHCVVFLDGDKNNLSLDNLALISMATNARRNQLGLHGNSSELGKIAVATAELLTLVGKRRRKK